MKSDTVERCERIAIFFMKKIELELRKKPWGARNTSKKGDLFSQIH